MRCLLLSLFLIGVVFACSPENDLDLLKIEEDRVISLAEGYLNAKPITVTAHSSKRSAGGIHDFYSEGDYWWPDPENPDGPYIRRDGNTNPDNFTKHREAMIRLSQIAGALTSAYLVTKDERYVKALLPHLKAWFIDDETLMTPNLLYGQAIKGITTGRGIGIIDTIHLMEVAQAVAILEANGIISNSDLNQIKLWFSSYLEWITKHPFGIDERDNGNNHSVCWAMQVATFAKLVGDVRNLDFCKNFYKKTLLPEQMDSLGRFPKELSRTKPYGYSLFNLDAMATLCHILKDPTTNLFSYETPDGRSLGDAFAFLYPYVADKNSWPYQQDVMYWDEWPVRHPWLLFGGLALNRSEYISLWKKLEPNFTTPEVVRNMPIRYPLLWVKLK